jgi:hypothetical protein
MRAVSRKGYRSKKPTKFYQKVKFLFDQKVKNLAWRDSFNKKGRSKAAFV